jgi:hypothetical protein
VLFDALDSVVDFPLSDKILGTLIKSLLVYVVGKLYDAVAKADEDGKPSPWASLPEPIIEGEG